MRADFYLSSHGYVSSRTRATSLISEGLVWSKKFNWEETARETVDVLGGLLDD